MVPAKMLACSSIAPIMHSPSSTLHNFPPNRSPSIVPKKTKNISCNFNPFSVIVQASPMPESAYPSPNPEFAAAETGKFRSELLKELSMEKDTFGDDLQAVVEVCSEILHHFLHNDYGGPGTLLVEPFTDMFVAIKERRLAGASTAARTSLLWAQNNIDDDWKAWVSGPQKSF